MLLPTTYLHPYPYVVFDFDGTLIDSYLGIKHSFEYAYQHTFSEAIHQDIRPLIGPSLRDILSVLMPSATDNQKQKFVDVFMEHYDTQGYTFSELYEGVSEFIQTLSKTHQLFICTNKRTTPTKLLLAHFGLTSFFGGVYCSDMLPTSDGRGKIKLLAHLLMEHHIHPHEATLVGDTETDYEAAKVNGLGFLYFTKGYGSLDVEKLQIPSFSAYQ